MSQFKGRVLGEQDFFLSNVQHCIGIFNVIWAFAVNNSNGEIC